MRRFALAPRAASRSASLVQHRSYTGPMSIVGSLIMCFGCCLAGQCWANNLCNVQRFGLYRFKNQADEPQLPADYKVARWIGGFFGCCFWWVFVGPDKYRRSDMEKWSTRWGPF